MEHKIPRTFTDRNLKGNVESSYFTIVETGMMFRISQ